MFDLRSTREPIPVRLSQPSLWVGIRYQFFKAIRMDYPFGTTMYARVHDRLTCIIYVLLQVEYVNSKVYPIFPRYNILKDLIKDIMHHQEYMEVCHEVDPV